MGVSTILNAKRIILMAFSENKGTPPSHHCYDAMIDRHHALANVIQRLIENAMDPNVTVSNLQAHSNSEVRRLQTTTHCVT